MARCSLRTLGVLSGLALTLGGCAPDDQVAAPQVVAPRASVAVPGRYIAGLTGSARAFAGRVDELGGRIEVLHEGAGLAVVNGLSDAAAAELGRMAGVAELVADIEAQVITPAATVMQDAQVQITSQANPASAIFASWAWNQRTIGADHA